MTNYRSYRIIDGKPRWVIVNENGNIINKESSKEELKSVKDEKPIPQRITNLIYNDTNTCDKVKANGKKCENKLTPRNNPRREYKEGKWTGKWLCTSCYMKDYNMNNQRRTGNLNPNCPSFKGDLFEELTCRWRGVKNLNIENDNYIFSIDHSIDHELGIVQTKGSLYNPYNRWWKFNCENEQNKSFDNLIIYCASKDGRTIERIYIIPRKEILIRSSIATLKNPSKGGWYEEYRIKDEDILRTVNNIWRDIIKRKC